MSRETFSYAWEGARLAARLAFPVARADDVETSEGGSSAGSSPWVGRAARKVNRRYFSIVSIGNMMLSSFVPPICKKGVLMAFVSSSRSRSLAPAPSADHRAHALNPC